MGNFRNVTFLSSRKIFEHTNDGGKGVTFLRNVRNHTPSDTASYLRRLESSNRLSLYVITHLVVFSSTLHLRHHAPRSLTLSLYVITHLVVFSYTLPLRHHGLRCVLFHSPSTSSRTSLSSLPLSLYPITHLVVFSSTLSLRHNAPRCVQFQIFELSTFSKCNRTQLIRINREGQPSG